MASSRNASGVAKHEKAPRNVRPPRRCRRRCRRRRRRLRRSRSLPDRRRRLVRAETNRLQARR